MNIDTLPYKQCSHLSGGPNRHELIVVHTNEGPETNGAAQGLANYLARPDITPGYHIIVDNNGGVRCAQDDQVPWGAGGVNSRALHVCIIGYSAQGPSEWSDPYSTSALVNAADVVRQWSQRYGIPVDRHYHDVANQSGKGLVGHVDVSAFHPESAGHTDPGPFFPWDRFIALVNGQPGDDVMTPAQEAKLDTLLAFMNEIKGGKWVLAPQYGVNTGADIVGKVQTSIKDAVKAIKTP